MLYIYHSAVNVVLSIVNSATINIGVHVYFSIMVFSGSISSVQFSHSVVSVVTPWTASRRASLSITNSWSLLKFMSIESVMPYNHLNLCHPLLLLPPIPPSIRIFSNASTLRVRWPKYRSFSFSISPSDEHPGLTSFRMDGSCVFFEI